MYETMIVTILVAFMMAYQENGGFESILQFIKRNFKGSRGGQAGVALLTSLMDVATANNTVAIVAAGPIAKDISKEFDITPQRTASIMDIFSCVWQGIIPYGSIVADRIRACGDLIAEYNPVPVLSVPAVHKCDTCSLFSRNRLIQNDKKKGCCSDRSNVTIRAQPFSFRK